ncbi:MAG: cohesin domain-containing protein [bacterium]
MFKKLRLLKISLLTCLTVFFMLSSLAIAKQVEIYFQPEKVKIIPGEEKSIELFVKNAPEVYGVELGLSFNPEILEVVNTSKHTDEIKIEHGDFFDHKKAMVIQNQADNDIGTLNYVLTMLNPTPAVQGNGKLIQIGFRGKQLGEANLKITKAKFGTRKGTAIVPSYHADLNFVIAERVIDFYILIILLFGGVLIFIIAGFILRQKKEYRTCTTPKAA